MIIDVIGLNGYTQSSLWANTKLQGIVAKHYSCTFYLKDISWLAGQTLAMNRDLTVDFLDDNYVDELLAEFVTPPEVSRSKDALPDLLMSDAHQQSLTLYQQVYERLVDAGVPTHQARQAARYALPAGHAVRLVATGSISTWQTFIDSSLCTNDLGHPTGDLETHNIAACMLYRLHQQIPIIVHDLWNRRHESVLNAVASV